MTKRIDRSNISLYPCVPLWAFKDEDEARTIEALSKRFSPLPEIQEEKGICKRGDVFENKWAIIGWWLVYFRTRAVNVKNLPYILPDFKAGRSYAWLLNKRLDLFAGVLELLDIEQYPTPLKGFRLHIEQLQQAEKQAKLLGLTYPQRETYREAKRKLKQLSEAKVPFTESRTNSHHYKLLNAATCLVRYPTSVERKKFKRDYWQPYLNALEDWIEDLGGGKYTSSDVIEECPRPRKRGRPPKKSKREGRL